MSREKYMQTVFRFRFRRNHSRDQVRPQPFWAIGARCVLPLITLLALAWFLIRVIPKPIRATYPCQRAAFPLVSGFVIWLLGLKGCLLAARELKVQLKKLRPRLIVAGVVFASGLVAWGVVRLSKNAADAWAPSDLPNSPSGEAKGIYPGRVTWLRNTNATPWNGTTGHWWDDTNGTSQAVVDRMMSRSLRTLTGTTNDTEAWDRIFRFYNNSHDRGNVGYQSGEKIAIKINLNNTASYADVDNQADASPQSVLAILRQLVNKAGVPEAMITVYEAPNTAPSRVIPNRIFDKCHAEFPNVIIADCTGTSGHTLIQWQANVINYSVANACGRNIPTCVYQATYVINMSLLKGHSTAGVTLTAKNHYGSINAREHTFIDCDARPMGTYSPFVDLIGQPHLGGKTILFMIDGLYGVRSVGDTVNAQYGRWTNLFGGQWSASYFMSLDPVAIDSVGVDFLRSEFTNSLGGGANTSSNCDNYLHEAALANSPPSGTFYTNQGTGLRQNSLGTHEHWNNSTNKQYSRNLSTNGTGIELVAIHSAPGISVAITDPATGTWFSPGTNITLQATASASYSVLSKVDFYRSGLLIGTRTNNPFSLLWSNPPAGSWALSAVATDSDFFAATSAVVNVSIQTNSPPVLAPIADRAVSAGITLTVTNSVTDPDVPPQSLAYSLPTAPAGAVIGTNTGLITWRPAAAQADTTNLLTVRVADDGSPSLSATQSFGVTVNKLALPILSAAVQSNGQFCLQIVGDFGLDYLIQTSTNLSSPTNWITVFATNSPPLPFYWIDTSPPQSPLRFYRIRLEP